MNEVRVVVVDDIPEVAAALAELLGLDGYSVRVANDGIAAIALIDAYKPHCVLLDVGMPGLDGAQLTKRLRATYGDDIVLIAITGGGTGDSRVTETFALVDHYLAKPVGEEQLRKLLPPLG